MKTQEVPPPAARRAATKFEGKDARDRRLVAGVTRRVGCALRKMRAAKLVRGERDKSGAAVWSVDTMPARID